MRKGRSLFEMEIESGFDLPDDQSLNETVTRIPQNLMETLCYFERPGWKLLSIQIELGTYLIIQSQFGIFPENIESSINTLENSRVETLF